jgi:hypothetical protein
MMVEGGDTGGEDWMQRREIHQLQVQIDTVKMEKNVLFRIFAKNLSRLRQKWGVRGEKTRLRWYF